MALSDKDIEALFAEIRKDFPAEEKVAAINAIFTEICKDIPAEKKMKAVNRLCQFSKRGESAILKESSRNNPFYNLNIPLSVSRDLWLHVLETMPKAVKKSYS